MFYLILLFTLTVLVVAVKTSKKNLIKKNVRMKTSWVQVGMIIQKRFDLVNELFEKIKINNCESVEKILEAKNIYYFASDVSSKVGVINRVEKYFKELEKLDKIYPDYAYDSELLEAKESIIKLNKDIIFAKLCYNQSVYDFNKQSEKGINRKMTKILHLEEGKQLI